MSFVDAPTASRLGVVLVVHNGLRWLPVILGTIAEWRIAGLELVVVDNGSTDGSADLLESRVTPDRLIRLPGPGSFASAVEAGRTHPALANVPLLLMLHDDLVMTVDAVSTLLATMEADPEVAVAGPKLREWSQEPLLQTVGQRVDPFGRYAVELDPGEIDQGQHDEEADTLFVPTAGMIVRTEVFDQLGGFDQRMGFEREDLDLCWRAWIAGHRVRVIPLAIGYHVAAGERGARSLGDGRAHHLVYLTERNTLAALLRNYGLARLALLLPIGIVLFCARAFALLVTRRVGPAVAGLRAVGWNIANLPGTLALRRGTQRSRRRTDGDLRPLFASPFARLRDYGDGFGTWISGARTPHLIDDQHAAAAVAPPRTVGAFLLAHPVLIVGPLLLVIYLLGSARLLGSGQMIGGQVLPWPDSATAFVRTYVSAWQADPLGSSALSSPIQFVLGLVSYLGVGSMWLAQRLAVLGLVPLAFLLTIRAGRLLSTRVWPRLLGATVYVLSPPVLGALVHGRYGELLLAALLPGLVVAVVWSADFRRTPTEGWRAAALVALALAVLWAAAPGAWIVPGGVWLAAVLVAATLSKRRSALLRTVTAGGLALLVVAPWLIDVARAPVEALDSAPFAPVAAWQALLVAPDVLPNLTPIGGLPAALVTLGVVGSALLLTGRGRASAVVVLLTVIVLFGLIAWAYGFTGSRVTWLPSLLLPSALALAGLATLAARSISDHLRGYSFGSRQIAAGICALALTLGLGGGIVRLVSDPYEDLRIADDLVPAFVTADGDVVGPYRVLLVSADGDRLVWDVTDDDGPSMVEFGAIDSQALTAGLTRAVAAIGVGDPRAASDLGLLNVRYVVVQDRGSNDQLTRLLAAQPALEPFPSGDGQVFAVASWLPRAVVVPAADADSPQAALALRSTAGLEQAGLRRTAPGTYTGAAAPGWLLLSEEASTDWDVTLDGTRLDPVSDVAGNVYEITQAGTLLVAPGSRTPHLLRLLAQLVVVIGILSLALRPPRSGQRREGIDDVHVGPHPAPMPGPAARAAAAATITGDLR